MTFDDGLLASMFGLLLGALPWLAGCTAGLAIVLLRGAHSDGARKLAVAGFVLLLATCLGNIPVLAWLQSMAPLRGYTAAHMALLYGVVGGVRSLVDATALVLIAIAVGRRHGARTAPDGGDAL